MKKTKVFILLFNIQQNQGKDFTLSNQTSPIQRRIFKLGCKGKGRVRILAYAFMSLAKFPWKIMICVPDGFSVISGKILLEQLLYAIKTSLKGKYDSYGNAL